MWFTGYDDHRFEVDGFKLICWIQEINKGSKSRLLNLPKKRKKPRIYKVARHENLNVCCHENHPSNHQNKIRYSKSWTIFDFKTMPVGWRTWEQKGDMCPFCWMSGKLCAWTLNMYFGHLVYTWNERRLFWMRLKCCCSRQRLKVGLWVGEIQDLGIFWATACVVKL